MTPRSPSIVWRLIAKDLYLLRWLIVGSTLVGFGALCLIRPGEDDGSSGVDLGFLLFLTTVIAFGIFVPMQSILKERQDRSLLFVLSLPTSPSQYVRAKVTAALLSFSIPWLSWTGAVLVLTLATDRPDGGLPFFAAIMGFLMGNFCTLTALIAMARSERWPLIGILVTNVAVTPFLGHLGRLPGIAGRTREAAATWSPEVLTLLAGEAVWVALLLGLALTLPTRRRDVL